MRDLKLKALIALSDKDVANSAATILMDRGAEKVFQAECTQAAICEMVETEFNFFIVDSRVPVSMERDTILYGGIDYIRFIRICEGPVSESTVVFLRYLNSSQNVIESLDEIEEAKNAGANVVVSAPLSMEKFEHDVLPCFEKPSRFIRSTCYIGPCRRNKKKAVTLEKRKLEKAARYSELTRCHVSDQRV